MSKTSNKSQHHLEQSLTRVGGALVIASGHATIINPLTYVINNLLNEKPKEQGRNKLKLSRIFDGLAAAKIGASLRISTSIILNDQLNSTLSNPSDKQINRATWYSAMIGGFIGGIISNPWEMIAQRQQVNENNPGSTFELVKNIVKSGRSKTLVNGSATVGGRSLFFGCGYLYAVPKLAEAVRPYAPCQTSAYLRALFFCSLTLNVPITVLNTIRFWKHIESTNQAPESYSTIVKRHPLMGTYKVRLASTTLSFFLLTQLNNKLHEYLNELSHEHRESCPTNLN
jgi:hypothetical protein